MGDYKMKDFEQAMVLAHSKFGVKFTRRQFDKFAKENSLPSVPTIAKRFGGSFTRAKEFFLGPKSAVRKPFSEELLKEAFDKVSEKHGRHFTQKQYKEFTVGTHYPSATTIHAKYGSFNIAKRELIGAHSVNFWGNTTGVNYKNFKEVDNRLLSRRMNEYNELGLSDDDMLKNIKNYEKDKDFANYCLTCLEIKGCHQNKKRCPYYGTDDMI